MHVVGLKGAYGITILKPSGTSASELNLSKYFADVLVNPCK